MFLDLFYRQDWDRNRFSRLQWNQDAPSDELTLTTTTIVSKFSKKFVYMHILLHIDDDFDDDLLLDALRVLRILIEMMRIKYSDYFLNEVFCSLSDSNRQTCQIR